MVFLIKTKLAEVEMTVVKGQLGEFDRDDPDSRGCAGALVLLSHKTLNVSFLSNSLNHINEEAEWFGRRGKW